jgi:methylmalonyl-CoA mutase N-terminal domain/subunit
MMLRFHAQTAGSTLTAQQPENNIVRTTLQALAAVLGGAQSLHANGYDEALALPTQEAARIALRTQQILAHESGVAQTIDPLAGSYYIESLTGELESQASEYLRKIDATGGMLRAIEKGWVQQQIQNAAYRHQQQVDSGEAIIVGVNRFTGEDNPETPTPEIQLQRIDESAERQQVERVKSLRLRRDNQRWQSAIDTVTNTARSRDNLMPAILEAVESNATVGEIAGAMRQVFGEYQETVVV